MTNEFDGLVVVATGGVCGNGTEVGAFASTADNAGPRIGARRGRGECRSSSSKRRMP